MFSFLDMCPPPFKYVHGFTFNVLTLIHQNVFKRVPLPTSGGLLKYKPHEFKMIEKRILLFVPRNSTLSYNHQGTYLFTSNINKEEIKPDKALCCLKKDI